MSWKKWTLQHTFGAMIGILTPIAIFPLVLVFLAWMQDYYFEFLWAKFNSNNPYQIKILTISIIANLFWFYFFLNRKKYDHVRGIIIGSIAFAPYVLYVKFF